LKEGKFKKESGGVFYPPTVGNYEAKGGDTDTDRKTERECITKKVGALLGMEKKERKDSRFEDV